MALLTRMTRRHAVACGGVSALLALAGPAGAEAIKPNVSKAGSWLLGDKLSLAAIGYGRNVKKETVDKLLADAKSLAQSLGVDVLPFPPRSSREPETLATMIHYLIKGDGWSTGKALVKKYDYAHGVMFEVSVKANLLLLLYQPGDDSGIGSIIRSRCEEIKLPRQLWGDVVAKINRKAPVDQVREAVFKMQKDVPAFLLNG